MKKLLGLLAAIALLTTSAAEPPFLWNSRPQRSIKIDASDSLRLTPGKATAEIVLPPGSSPVTAFAARELKTFLEQRLSCNIPIVATPTGGKFALILGINALSGKAGINAAALCRDAFILKSAGRNTVHILGRDDPTARPEQLIREGGHMAHPQNFERGTLFGVYDFLERFAGIRFYFPHRLGIVVPRGDMLIPRMDIYERPDFEARFYCSPYRGYWPGDERITNRHQASPDKNLSLYRNRMQTKYVANNHALHHLQLVKRFGKNHPEYFAMDKAGKRMTGTTSGSGHPCLSSALVGEIRLDAEAYLTGKPAASRNLAKWSTTGNSENCFGLMPADGFYFCNCPECQAHFSKGGQASSDFLWGYVDQVARSLQKKRIPGYVSNLAYHFYKTPPSFKLPSNVLVMVALNGPWSENKPEQCAADDQLIRAWNRKVGHPVWLWNYALKYSGLLMPGIPASTPRSFASYYKRNAQWICGAFVECGTDFYIFNYLNYYMLGKVCWNSSVDADALLREHCEKMFGAGAPEMLAFFDTIEALWMEKITGKSVMTAVGPVTKSATEHELFREIYSPEKRRELAALFDRAEKKCADDSASLERVRFIRREFLDRIVEAAVRHRRHNDSVAGFYGTVPGTLHLQPLKPGSKSVPAKTTVEVSEDAKNFRFFFRCAEPEMSKIISQKINSTLNELWHDNTVELFFDPEGQRRNYHQLIVNSEGLMYAANWKMVGGRKVKNGTWAVKPEIKTVKYPTGWTAEIAVPKKALGGFNGKSPVANFARVQLKPGVTNYYSWSPFLRSGFHDPERFGTLRAAGTEPLSLLRNGDFTGSSRSGRNFAAWGRPRATAANGKVTADDTTFIKGGRSVRFDSDGRGGSVDLVQSFPRLTPGKRYSISYYIKLDKVVPLQSGFRRAGATVLIFEHVNRAYPVTGLQGSAPWTKYSFEFTASPETRKNPYIRLMLEKCSGTAWLDDVKLEKL